MSQRDAGGTRHQIVISKVLTPPSITWENPTSSGASRLAKLMAQGKGGALIALPIRDLLTSSRTFTYVVVPFHFSIYDSSSSIILHVT